jgi:RsmE family RNA methyltransferase
VNAEAQFVNLVLLAEDEVAADGTVSLTGARARHIVQVLGSRAGDQVRVGVLDGRSGVGTVTAMDPATVQLHCRFDTAVAPQPRIDILLALPRPKVMRRLWAQLAALGVGRIILTNAARVERHYFDTHILTEASYRPLLIEGLQQARDTRLPLVTIRRQFKILVEDELDGLCGGSVRVAAHPGAASSLFDAVRAHAGSRVLLAIGPEGGWTGFELDLLRSHGFHLTGTGARILRSDTACVAMLALAHEALAGVGRSAVQTSDGPIPSKHPA